MNPSALIVFAKNEIAGQVKTRLAATTGAPAALCVYRELLHYTAALTETLQTDKFIFYSSYIPIHDLWDQFGFQKQLQQGSDLGERMLEAFAFAFGKGYEKVVLIGTDCPELTTGILTAAFHGLQTHEVIIGPAADGGYYLIGMTRPMPQLFRQISWSTPDVLSETLQRTKQVLATFFLLPTLQDLDDAAALFSLQQKLDSYPAHQRTFLSRLLLCLK